MRLFVGIELPDGPAAGVESALARLRSQIHRSCPDLAARWVRRANLHLTLVFIGEVADSELAAMQAALAPRFAVDPFNLGIDRFGVFPGAGPLRAIWMGVAGGSREMTRLHDEVQARLARPAESRPYSPHLTVARFKNARGPSARAAREIVRAAPAVGVTMRVADVVLVRSRLSADGPAYKVLLRVPLRE